jgi:hypothetical protein
LLPSYYSLRRYRHKHRSPSTIPSARGGGATSQAATISVAAGHTIVVIEIFNPFTNGGTPTSPTDTGGNAYTAGNHTIDGANRQIYTYWSIGIANAVTSVTANTTGSTGAGGFVEVIVWDISATGTITANSSAAVVNTGTTLATDALTTGSMAVTSTDALLVGAAKDMNSNPTTAGTGFTSDAVDANNFHGEHMAVTASGAATWTDSTAGDFALIAGLALQVSAPVVTNGVVMSNGHPVMSNGHVLYQ